MLAGQPWMLHAAFSRPFVFRRGAGPDIAVRATLRGMRAGELANSAFQADGFMVIDARPLMAAGINYLMRFDRFFSSLGESYSVQESRPSFDGETAVFFKAYVQGATQ